MTAPVSVPRPTIDALLLRPVERADAAQIAEIYEPIVRETTISFELEPPGEEEIWRRVEATTAQFPWLVAEIQGRVLAYAYASVFRSRPAYRFGCESTIYVAAEARGTGVAQSLYTALLAVLKTQGFAMVYAGISLPNEPSVRFHESMGFSRVGTFRRAGWKLGRWSDAVFYQRELTPEADPQADPIPWPALRRDTSTLAILAPPRLLVQPSVDRGGPRVALERVPERLGRRGQPRRCDVGW